MVDRRVHKVIRTPGDKSLYKYPLLISLESDSITLNSGINISKNIGIYRDTGMLNNWTEQEPNTMTVYQ